MVIPDPGPWRRGSVSVTLPRGNVSRQICNLTRQINEVFLDNAFIFR